MEQAMVIDIRNYQTVRLTDAVYALAIAEGHEMAIWFTAEATPTQARLVANSADDNTPLICYNLYRRTGEGGDREVMGRLIASSNREIRVDDDRDGITRTLTAALYIPANNKIHSGELIVSRHPHRESANLNQLYWPGGLPGRQEDAA
jgi:hypothetical protein